jgi:hypothetical protein
MIKYLSIILITFYHLVMHGSAINVKESEALVPNEPVLHDLVQLSASRKSENDNGSNEKYNSFKRNSNLVEAQVQLPKSIRSIFLTASIFANLSDNVNFDEEASPDCYLEITEACLLKAFQAGKDLGNAKTAYKKVHLPFDYVKVHKHGTITMTYTNGDCLTFHCLHRPTRFENLEVYAAYIGKLSPSQTSIDFKVNNMGLHYNRIHESMYLVFERDAYKVVDPKNIIANLISYSDSKTVGKILEDVEAFYDKIGSHSYNRMLVNLKYKVEKSKQNIKAIFKSGLAKKDKENFKCRTVFFDYPITASTRPIMFVAEPALTLATMLDHKLSAVAIPKQSKIMLNLKPDSKHVIPINYELMQEDFAKWVATCMPMKLEDVSFHFIESSNFIFKVTAVTLYKESKIMAFHGIASSVSITLSDHLKASKNSKRSMKFFKYLSTKPPKKGVVTQKTESVSIEETEDEPISRYCTIKASVSNNFVSKRANDYGLILLTSDYKIVKHGQNIVFVNCLTKKITFR